MAFSYVRMSHQGEIHITKDNSATLCGEPCTHWYEVADVDDRTPQLCPECKEYLPKDKTKERKPRERPKRAKRTSEGDKPGVKARVNPTNSTEPKSDKKTEE